MVGELIQESPRDSEDDYDNRTSSPDAQHEDLDSDGSFWTEYDRRPRVRRQYSDDSFHEQRPRVRTPHSDDSTHEGRPRVRATYSDDSSYEPRPRVSTHRSWERSPPSRSASVRYEENLAFENNFLQQHAAVQNHDEALCDRCSSIDINRVIGRRTGRYEDEELAGDIELCILSEALMNADHCAFCKFVVDCARNYLEERHDAVLLSQSARSLKLAVRAVLENAASDMKTAVLCDICRDWLPQGLYLRTTDTATYSLVALRFALSTEKYKLMPASDGMFAVQLDVVGLPAANVDFSAAFAMKRVLLQHSFDPNRLKSWLLRSEHLPRDTQDEFYAWSLRQGEELPAPSVSYQGLLGSDSFRLIDVTSGKLVTPEEHSRYVALSYVWGSPIVQHLAEKTVKTNGLARHINLKTLPRTIRDAAKLVSDINEKYLWVDAYCIDQSDAKDVQENIARMAAIYQNAYFTIVAADGENADNGLIRLGAGQSSAEQPVSIGSGEGRALLIRSRPTIFDMLQDTKWNSRAWTFQESLLSVKKVSFTKSEVLFESKKFASRESLELIEIPYLGTRPGGFTFSENEHRTQNLHEFLLDPHYTGLGLELFVEALREYTSKQLTYNGDRLDAFMGVFDRFCYSQSRHHKAILSGMPKQWFSRALSLIPTGQGIPVRLSQDSRGSRCLPSWSWAGWTGTAVHDITDQRDETEDGQCEVIDATNITCNLARTEWMSALALAELTHPVQVVLHVWALTIPCKLERLTKPRTDDDERSEQWRSNYAIVITHAGIPEIRFSSPTGMTFCSAEVDLSLEHCLISIWPSVPDKLYEEFLLVEQTGEFAEVKGRLLITLLEEFIIEVEEESTVDGKEMVSTKRYSQFASPNSFAFAGSDSLDRFQACGEDRYMRLR